MYKRQISNKKDMQVRFKIRNRNNTMMIVRWRIVAYLIIKSIVGYNLGERLFSRKYSAILQQNYFVAFLRVDISLGF